ncbi:MAG: hypothetical protein VXY53_08410 [Candidatus Thermoplasmatota archaeon]|nr:hypothetical protein [Candidatus Thermoplasmatota archaeon]
MISESLLDFSNTSNVNPKVMGASPIIRWDYIPTGVQDIHPAHCIYVATENLGYCGALAALPSPTR